MDTTMISVDIALTSGDMPLRIMVQISMGNSRLVMQAIRIRC